MWHWLLLWTGGTNGNTPQYLEWSGFIPDLALIGGLSAWWHKHTCQEDRCRRLGHHVTVESNGHHFRRCRRHHVIRHEPQPEGATL